MARIYVHQASSQNKPFWHVHSSVIFWKNQKKELRVNKSAEIPACKEE